MAQTKKTSRAAKSPVRRSAKRPGKAAGSGAKSVARAKSPAKRPAKKAVRRAKPVGVTIAQELGALAERITKTARTVIEQGSEKIGGEIAALKRAATRRGARTHGKA